MADADHTAGPQDARQAGADAPPGRAAPFRPPGGQARRYTLRDQWLDLVRIPQKPHPLMNWRRLLTLAKRTTDFFGHRRVWWNDLLVRINPYPHPFRRVSIESFDGTVVSGWLALQPVPRPGVVIVPGMFSSKDDTVHKRRAIRMWRRWNYNVLIIELRGFGQSDEAPNTPGWKEAEDVLAAARFLHAFNSVTRIGVMAESLGATAAMLAAAQEGLWEEQAFADQGSDAAAMGPGVAEAARKETWRLPGARPMMDRSDRHADDPEASPAQRASDASETGPGTSATFRPGPARMPASGPHGMPKRVIDAVLAFAPFSEPDRAVAHISRLPPRKDPFYRVQRLFARLLSLHTRGRYQDFQEYMEHAADQYGVTLEELYARSDLRQVVRHVRCPALVVHAEDDPTTPVDHAHRLNEATRDMEDVVVWVLPWGQHCEFDILDRRWFWRVSGRFLGQWVGR